MRQRQAPAAEGLAAEGAGGLKNAGGWVGRAERVVVIVVFRLILPRGGVHAHRSSATGSTKHGCSTSCCRVGRATKTPFQNTLPCEAPRQAGPRAAAARGGAGSSQPGGWQVCDVAAVGVVDHRGRRGAGRGGRSGPARAPAKGFLKPPNGLKALPLPTVTPPVAWHRARNQAGRTRCAGDLARAQRAGGALPRRGTQSPPCSCA